MTRDEIATQRANLLERTLHWSAVQEMAIFPMAVAAPAAAMCYVYDVPGMLRFIGSLVILLSFVQFGSILLVAYYRRQVQKSINDHGL